ncbi:MAG: hypothetical protein ACR2GN_08360 [Bacteroidia bacterium]
MKKRVMISVMMLLFSIATFAQDRKPATLSKQQAEQFVQGWPGTAKKSATAMIQKYGAPNEYSESMLIWNNNGPWLRTIVYKEEVDHHFPIPHKDVLEQFVGHEVPVDKFSALAQYDGSVIVERTKGEMSARCDTEEANLLALNLAHDIIEGKRSVEDARQFYSQTMMQFMKGEKPEYTQKLMFTSRPNAGYKDKPVMSEAQMKEMKEMMKDK